MAFSAILLFPKLAASAWESGTEPRLGDPDRPATATSSACSTSVARAVRARAAGGRAWRCSSSGSSPRLGSKAWRLERRAARRAGAVVLAGAAALVALLAWAWWPAGQYRPVRPTDDGTLVGAFADVSAPAAAARPAARPRRRACRRAATWPSR